jgi:hypothetical protein
VTGVVIAVPLPGRCGLQAKARRGAAT